MNVSSNHSSSSVLSGWKQSAPVVTITVFCALSRSFWRDKNNACVIVRSARWSAGLGLNRTVVALSSSCGADMVILPFQSRLEQQEIWSGFFLVFLRQDTPLNVSWLSCYFNLEYIKQAVSIWVSHVADKCQIISPPPLRSCGHAFMFICDH